MAWRNKVARCKRIPDGWELLESTLEEFEQTMREAGTSYALPLRALIGRRAEAPPVCSAFASRAGSARLTAPTAARGGGFLIAIVAQTFASAADAADAPSPLIWPPPPPPLLTPAFFFPALPRSG